MTVQDLINKVKNVNDVDAARMILVGCEKDELGAMGELIGCQFEERNTKNFMRDAILNKVYGPNSSNAAAYQTHSVRNGDIPNNQAGGMTN
jgi:hypothetical protein